MYSMCKIFYNEKLRTAFCVIFCLTKGLISLFILIRIENAFLVSVVGARPEKYFWIGLSNQKDPHTFEWTNTKKVSFTHFNAGMPGTVLNVNEIILFLNSHNYSPIF